MKPAIRDHKTIWKKFGPWLRRQREISGKSRKWVADKIGVHYVQLGRIEAGESGTRKDTLDALIACLGLDAKEAYIRAGLWPQTIEEIEAEKRERESIEETLQNASFFDRKGIRQEDRAAIRPLLESADRMIELLKGRNIEITKVDKIEDLEELGGPHAVRERDDN